MLDSIGDLVSGLVELVARGVYGVLRLIFRWETAPERPAWVRAVAIVLILLVTAVIASVFFAFLTMAFYVLVAVAVIGAIIAFLGLG